MSPFKKAAVRFLAETFVGNALCKAGEHVGDALGVVLGRKIDPEHGKVPEPKDDKSDDKGAKK